MTQVPGELGQLESLRYLNLSKNQLIQVPAELGQLKSLQELNLRENQLTQVPIELGQLESLPYLNLSKNQLIQVPGELGQLEGLRYLYLSENQLTQVPAELGQLQSLQELYLRENQLTQVPIKLGQLKSLQYLGLSDNPDLLTPPPEIITQGTEAMLGFLRELQKDNVVRYEAKVVVVGQGETGKSSLLRALRHEAFVVDLPTTHGIEVGRLSFPHPYLPETELTLNTWDFGGQHI